MGKIFSGGRSVVETRKYKVIDHHLKHCAIAHYASAVVEWSNIFENHKLLLSAKHEKSV